jgi:hypothetical protein
MKKMLAGSGSIPRQAARWLAKHRAADAGVKEANPAPNALRGEYQFSVLRQAQLVFAPVVHDQQLFPRSEKLGARDPARLRHDSLDGLGLRGNHMQTIIILKTGVKAIS